MKTECLSTTLQIHRFTFSHRTLCLYSKRFSFHKFISIKSLIIKSNKLLCRQYSTSNTPYSDKYYQPIISEGASGFIKLNIPKDFVANNQLLVQDDDEIIDQDNLIDIVNSIDASIEVSIGYGSGILAQNGYKENSNEEKQLDFINLVPDCHQFHKKNLNQNLRHYSIKSLRIVNIIQGREGIYFNPFVSINKKLVKYGIISTESALMDLSEWNSFYFAGRLQKPVNFIIDKNPMVKFMNQYNLKNAMAIAIFLIKSNEFSEKELYEQITKLSYLGDFRMYVGGENPNKVKNIVSKQFEQFKKLYEPIINYFIHRNYLIIVNNDPVNRLFKKNLQIPQKIKLISCLPLQFRTQLYKKFQDKSLKEIVKHEKLADHITSLISRIIIISSIKQGIRGIFSAGLFKSIKYALAKQLKFWNHK
ncbi:unnamed protein product [Candida verbasci]|uniref:Phosphatidate cytidylyltransferase, mitochondrial n=1 Tax=Candida verbasci TaxID=1227364 RepID=A0A9W4TZ87_9ASCO|nr:unnamed protein product [Candida verbasci]